MSAYAEPTIELPPVAQPMRNPTIPANRPIGQTDRRYVPERGLVRRLRSQQANDGIDVLTNRHKLDSDTRDVLSAELIKAGAPPITQAAAKIALTRLVRFEPLNADALRPFILLAGDRMLRAHAVARIGDAMRSAGRSVRLLSDAIDATENDILISAGERLGCGMQQYDGSPNCVDILRQTDLACLSLIEAGFRAPLDRVALLRLTTLVQATGSEPVAVIRPSDAKLAIELSRIGVRRVVLVQSHEPMVLGPVLTALRKANLALAEIMDVRSVTAPLRAATADDLAAMLVDGATG